MMYLIIGVVVGLIWGVVMIINENDFINACELMEDNENE